MSDDARIASAPVPVVVPPEPVECEQVKRPQPSRVNNFPSYEPYRVSKVVGDLTAFYLPSADSRIRQIIEDVVGQEGPVSMELTARRVAGHWGIGKIGSKVAKRISQIASSANITKTKTEGRIFLWPPGVDPGDYKIFRVPGNDDNTRRNADELPPEEIANAALSIIENQVSMPADDLVSETARMFGFARTGQTVALCLRTGIDILLRRGDATEQHDIITRKR
jgi:hypothetical protein